jgi:hypothetical protein
MPLPQILSHCPHGDFIAAARSLGHATARIEDDQLIFDAGRVATGIEIAAMVSLLAAADVPQALHHCPHADLIHASRELGYSTARIEAGRLIFDAHTVATADKIRAIVNLVNAAAAATTQKETAAARHIHRNSDEPVAGPSLQLLPTSAGAGGLARISPNRG